jgi:hypothetical protein
MAYKETAYLLEARWSNSLAVASYCIGRMRSTTVWEKALNCDNI